MYCILLYLVQYLYRTTLLHAILPFCDSPTLCSTSPTACRSSAGTSKPQISGPRWTNFHYCYWCSLLIWSIFTSLLYLPTIVIVVLCLFDLFSHPCCICLTPVIIIQRNNPEKSQPKLDNIEMALTLPPFWTKEIFIESAHLADLI